MLEMYYQQNSNALKWSGNFNETPKELRFQRLPDGVEFAESDQSRLPPDVGYSRHYYIYRPSATTSPRSLPCILIAPAGSNLVTGMDLSDGDKFEHLPYARAGFVVVAYALDGAPPAGALSDKDLARSHREFKDSCAGMVNARNALDYVLKALPEVDPSRIYVAGHSSAGTLALLYAEYDQRIKGCVAYAPSTDLEARLHPLAAVSGGQSPQADLRIFVDNFSPRNFEDHLSCPVFLFHADDDDNVPAQESRDFAERLKASHKNVTLRTVAHGGHRDAMIRDGIPQAINWLKNVDAGQAVGQK